MVPPAIGKLIVLAIGTSMWIWMQSYVKIQVVLYGEKILTPKTRQEPFDFRNGSLGSHHFVNITGIQVHYVTKGCGRSNGGRAMLLLLHGFLDFWYIWNRQIPILAQEFCVVAPDLRGYGVTTKPVDSAEYLMVKLVEDVKGLINALNAGKARKVVLVGHDWGGMIAFCFATLYEHMIQKMVIINGMHPLAFSKQLLRSLRQMRMSWYMIPFRHPVVPEQYLIMNDFAFFDKVHRGFTREEEDAHKYMFTPKGALTGAVNYYRAFNNDSDQLKKINYQTINVTTLILWGAQDAFLTKPVAKFNREWLKTSGVVYYPMAGHWLLRECSTEVTERIRTFARNGRVATQPSMTKWKGTRSNEGTCTESPTPGASRLSTLFAWLPRNTSVPMFTQE
uniref:Putative soluble epoxide hydrolase n=1 Tax=Amblyomma aureolatum TaxID=187763 RepID=A0A1E1XEU7_9ACAR